MSVLTEQPWLALVPAFVLLLAARLTHSLGAALCGATWLVYCAYEYSMKLRVMCTGECNIRVDLLALYPALVIISGLGAFLVVRSAFRRLNA